MKRVLCLVVTGMLVFVMLSSGTPMSVYAGDGHTYWVSPDGQAKIWENAKSDTPLEGAACASIKMANLRAAAGDTVYLRGGTYVCGDVIKPNNSGTSWENQIVFSPKPECQ